METMMCRITGHAKNMPKPCYFPILPPISPVEAKLMCRNTRYAGSHNYSPVIAYAKPVKYVDGISACSVTRFKGYDCFKPKPVMDNDDALFYQRLLDSMKNRAKREVSPDTSYLYEIPNLRKLVVLPGELEEAIRVGEVETLGLSENNEHISIKIKEGRTIKIEMEKVKPEVLAQEKISQGEGPNKEVIAEQEKVLEEREKRKKDTNVKRKLFEEKEKKAEEEDKKSKERPVSKKPKVEQKKKEIPPKEEICAVKIEAFDSPDFELSEIEQSEEEISELETSSEEEIEPIEIKPVKQPPKIHVNVQKIEVVAPVEKVEPAPEVKKEVVKAVTNLKKKELKQPAMEVITQMEVESVPSISDIESVVNCSEDDMRYGYIVKRESIVKFVEPEEYNSDQDECIPGVMMPVENELKFVAGQIIDLFEEQTFVAGQTVETDDGVKFVPGLTIQNDYGDITFIPGTKAGEEAERPTFVCGRIVEAEEKFVPGQYVDIGKEKEVFTPGQTVVVDDGLKFVPGETISNENGERKFIPGITLGNEDKTKFVPGKVFTSDEGLKFTPGQESNKNKEETNINKEETNKNKEETNKNREETNKIEEPTFVPGRSVDIPGKGKVFVKGKPTVNEQGKVSFKSKTRKVPYCEPQIIPNKNLNVVSDTNGEITGFNICPTNTADLKQGEKLDGFIVETENSVLFYLADKLPQDIDSSAKIISGELRVGDFSQRFIPGRVIKSNGTKKFVPGQVVHTNNGEEFVPGKIVETNEGPKFIPGQQISTEEGEKFVPGQVITDDDGPQFVPGQIIETETGSTFIPGQMMNTDKGRKFVPGQLVDTNEGPRFVPGQVVESPGGPKFLPGLIVETADGLKYVPSEADDKDDDMEFTFQGFDINSEELQLLSTSIDDSERHSPVIGKYGLIDSKTLKKLSCINMVVHGRSPEPVKQKKQKSKLPNVAFITTREKDEINELEDLNKEKLDILNGLVASRTTVSNHKKKKEIKKVMEIVGKGKIGPDESAEAIAISYILSSNGNDLDIITDYIGTDTKLIEDILSSIGNTDDIEFNGQVQNLFRNVMKGIVTKRCNDEIDNIITQISNNPDILYTDHKIQMLLAEAVGMVCVTGDVEAASLLEQFISKPNDPTCLKDNKDVLEVLRQLIVLHEIAKKSSDVAKILSELKKDPCSFKNKKEIFRLISQTNVLLRKEETSNKSFNIRHIASSKDIPNDIFEQLKEDKMEAEKFIDNLPDELFFGILNDDRCGSKLLDSLNPSDMSSTMREIQKFKKGMAIVVAKMNMQAVIPKHYSRSVYYGIMPYILIDEEGIKFYERGLTGRKLAPSKVVKNTWCDDDNDDDSDYICNNLHHSQFVPEHNQQYSIMIPGKGFDDDNPYLQYTSLLPSSGPTRLPYLEGPRRASREESLTSYRVASRSATPSRRSSTNSLYEYPLVPDSYSRRGSTAAASIVVAPTLSTIRNYSDDLEEEPTYKANSFNKIAVVPCQEDSDEDISPVCRSDTVANLLDKYTNFSVEREFAKPVISTKKSKPKNRRKKRDDVTVDEDLSLMQIGGNRSRSVATPENERYMSNGILDDCNNKKVNDTDCIRKRRLGRPISDIFEVDELNLTTGNSDRRKLNNSISSCRGHISDGSEDEDEDLVINKYALPVLSYRPRKTRNQTSKYSRRSSEPHMVKDDIGEYSGMFRKCSEPSRFRKCSEPSRFRKCSEPSRSEERDYLYSRGSNYENGDSLYGDAKKKEPRRRYRPLDDVQSTGRESVYDPSKPYSSNYLNSNEVSDEDERPSYQLLGRSVQTPSRVGGYGWQPGNKHSSILPRTYNNNPYNSSPRPNLYEPRINISSYNNDLLSNLNYNYEASPQLPVQNYQSRGNTPYMENTTNLVDPYSDPSVRNVLHKGFADTYKDKFSPRTKEKKYVEKNITKPKYNMKEQFSYDSEEDLRQNLPQIKKFDASRYLNDNDYSDYDDDQGESDPKANYSRGSSSEPDSAFEQRKLATDLAKKYLRSFSLEDKDEPEEEEEEIS